MMINRILEADIRYVAKKFPIVSLTGPRQSGKTTLLQKIFSKYPYISLEDPDQRLFAHKDPKEFLLQFNKGVILDEVHHVPELFSYIQTLSDKNKKTGFYILSGSQNFLLNRNISQSLAGRVGILKLLPFSLEELQQADRNRTLNDTIFEGFYPRLIDKKIKPSIFYSSYVETYLKRDVRDLIKVSDMRAFQKFILLCAGRVGQILNLSSLATDIGISVNTAKAWLSVLEASYIIFLHQPYHNNFNKRLIKSPKIYFWDTGLACYLLGMKSSSELNNFYARGSLFENLVVAEFGKHYFNRASEPSMYFWKDKTGNEVDCILDIGRQVKAVEVKSSSTFSDDFFKNLNRFHELNKSAQLHVVYGGTGDHVVQDTKVIGWKSMLKVFDTPKK